MTKAGSAEMALGHAPGRPPGTIRQFGSAPGQRGIQGVLFALTLAGCLYLAPGWVVASSKAEISPAEVDAITDAIYQAEGGPKTRHPFGVLSVKCDGYQDCRRICRNTVRNNHKRWLAAGQPDEFLAYLQRRYAPTQGATNDPTGSNRFWLKNVRYFLAKAGR